MTTDSSLCFSGNFNQSHISLLSPWCAPFYHGTSPQVNFLFLAFFLLVPYWQHLSQGLKNNLLGGKKPVFLISGFLPPKMLQPPTLKALSGWQSYKITIPSSLRFLSLYTTVFFHPVFIWMLPSSSCPSNAS